jgi:Tyrosine phosphatase family
VAGGGCVRTGMLYRGDSLDGITEVGVGSLVGLELKTAIDLREPIERHVPGVLSGAVFRYQSMPIFRLPAQQLAVVAGSPPELMLGVLNGVRGDVGSVAHYLRQHGVTPATLVGLERALIDVTADGRTGCSR